MYSIYSQYDSQNIPQKNNITSGNVIKVGIIGVGGRGTALLKNTGFVDADDYNNIYKDLRWK